MAQNYPLMPHATAAWLVDNTALTFSQIADFCGLHVLEVQAIADETASAKHIPRDPIRAGDLTQAELDKAQANPAHSLVLQKGPEQQRRTKGPRYTPVSKRQDRPNAIQWLLKNHPELKDAQIIRLVGTTKSTIQSVRERTHWNAGNLAPLDPVTLGLCSQMDLDLEVSRSAKDRPVVVPDQGATLIPAEITTAAEAPKKNVQLDAEHVFAKLKNLNPVEDDAGE